MKKVAVVYWTGTGNTKKMTDAICKGIKKGGARPEAFFVEHFSVTRMRSYDAVALGCPAMGNEELEERAFEPFFQKAKRYLSGVPVILFGSYGWGGGIWMTTWEGRVEDAGAHLFADGLIVECEPRAQDLAACEQLGADFAASLD